MTTFHVITLFPGAFDSYLGESILKRAIEDKKIRVKLYNPRDFAKNKWHRVDQRPYGGGPGMVIEALPVMKAIDKALQGSRRKRKGGRKARIAFFSPSGKQFTNAMADSFAGDEDIVLVCGRYEGIDARVKKAFPMAEVSVGPYTLTGGELPAMVMIDAISRRIPGVLGHEGSIEETRIASPDVYTRPEAIEFKGKKHRVPKVLLSGDRARIDSWKLGKKRS
ncbi:MAG: tRNA (guanosine(37)-N1)-methyltransferase TrmD [Patescibacteria group bacterium]|nr:tRNA (guanosine(37)-N1)-methyltransferase TrmD [Patescibacteria group bacterium]